ncbi:imidazoleglycerol-phosphate dehydratase [Tulasnella sp. 419]|nr:imidazoleglycerol-phosphate dehydratase [Tulasnella sp. 418]KAG8967161.1 imidazoleglycerol-phosphate dehydratase [Tulasnella sp. 419]
MPSRDIEMVKGPSAERKCSQNATIMSQQQLSARTATYSRKTNETDIEVSLTLDSDPTSSSQHIEISTGIGFLDHMYHTLAKHGGMSLQLKCKGDLWIDDHHTAD